MRFLTDLLTEWLWGLQNVPLVRQVILLYVPGISSRQFSERQVGQSLLDAGSFSGILHWMPTVAL